MERLVNYKTIVLVNIVNVLCIILQNSMKGLIVLQNGDFIYIWVDFKDVSLIYP